MTLYFFFFKAFIQALPLSKLTALSLVPEIASYRGLKFEGLVEKILLDASINK